jgi:small-conductance mechanosensitive channel
MRSLLAIVCVLILFVTVPRTAVPAENSAKAPSQEDTSIGSPVTLGDQTLFNIKAGIKAFSAAERAKAVNGRIKRLAEDPYFRIDTIAVSETDISTDILAGDTIIMSVFDRDAEAAKQARADLANENASKIRAAIEKYREDYGTKSILTGALYTAVATVVLIGLLILFRRSFRRVRDIIDSRFQARITSIHIQSFEIVQAERIRMLLNAFLSLSRIVIIVMLMYAYVHLVLSFFPWTRGFAHTLLDYFLVPLRVLGQALLDHVPGLFFIAVVALIARYVIKSMGLFFDQVERGAITLRNFYPEWAHPTYKLLRVGVIIFAIVVSYPYIPGSESPAFKGISIFVGVLLSLGSSSAVSNIIAGFALTYRRAFKMGDRIRIGDTVGDVIRMRVSVTHVRTVKNEEVVIPNSMILGSSVINYTSLAADSGLILHTKVTIGYDTPWRQVHALLLLAAERTAGLLKEPQPFVLQKSLDDFYVSYELNAYTNDSHAMARTYSDLHQNIQDAFNEFGVQIMSPNYEADRSVPTFVPKERWYLSPAKPPDEGGNVNNQ